MLYPTTITSKWQMTLTRDVRKLLDIKNPGRVLLDLDPRQRSIKVKAISSFVDLAGTFIPKKNKGASVLKAREYMEKHYERT